jgi:hypothetical protein
MEINTWLTPNGDWKAQYAGPIYKGATREEAYEAALKSVEQPANGKLPSQPGHLQQPQPKTAEVV